jgi:hypothetical protein
MVIEQQLVERQLMTKNNQTIVVPSENRYFSLKGVDQLKQLSYFFKFFFFGWGRYVVHLD